MAASAEEKLVRLRELRATLLAELQGWPESRLRFRAAPTDWSVLQMLDHVLRTEEAFPRVVRLSLPQRVKITAKDRLGCMGVHAAMLSPARLRVPPTATSVIPAEPDLAELEERWQRNDALLDTTVREVPAEDRRIGAFRHPVGGWMNLADGVGFLVVHLQHHLHQFKRIREASAQLA